MDEETVEIELKACPFCGSEGYLNVGEWDYCRVVCEDCQAEGGGFRILEGKRDERTARELAAEAWNQRIIQDELEENLKRMGIGMVNYQIETLGLKAKAGRYKKARFTLQILADLFIQDGRIDGITVKVGLPKDAKIFTAYVDFLKDYLVVIYEHPSFEMVQPGERIPNLVLTMQMDTVNPILDDLKDELKQVGLKAEDYRAEALGWRAKAERYGMALEWIGDCLSFQEGGEIYMRVDKIRGIVKALLGG